MGGERRTAAVGRRARPGITLACLLGEWLAADHGWRPSTVVGYRSAVGFLVTDRSVPGGRSTSARACWPRRSPRGVADGWPDPTVWARVRVLRSALGWAHAERILDRHPLDGCAAHRRPGSGCTPRSTQVRAILDHAHQQVTTAVTGTGAERSVRGCTGPSSCCC